MIPIYIASYSILSALGTKNNEIFQNLVNGNIKYSVDSNRENVYNSPLRAYLPETWESPIDMIGEYITKLWEVHDYLNPLKSDRPDRWGIIVSTDSNVEYATELNKQFYKTNTTKSIRSDLAFKTLNSRISMLMAIKFGIRGFSLTVCSACAGGGNAIGIAKLMIQTGLLDNCIVVGYQELNNDCNLSFDALRVFSKTKCRPFDKNRDGLVPSGGVACMLLTNNKSFSFCPEIVSVSFSVGTDKINPDMISIYNCMRNCIQNMDGELIYVNAHATGTKIGDAVELEAIHNLFPNGIPVVSTKALTGHEQWMCGISEIIYSLIQIINNTIVKQHNFEESEINYAKKYVLTENMISYNFTDKYILSNSFGFGGVNTSTLIKINS